MATRSVALNGHAERGSEWPRGAWLAGRGSGPPRPVGCIYRLGRSPRVLTPGHGFQELRGPRRSSDGQPQGASPGLHRKFKAQERAALALSVDDASDLVEQVAGRSELPAQAVR
jgi:hypothetical protein